MNLNHLSLFRSVAETGGFTRAAAARRISQPAISAQVAELESSLGVMLFDRLPRGVRLTQAGEHLLSYARRLAGVEEEAERSLAELRGVRAGLLAVAASRSIGTYWLPEILGRFQRKHPDVKIELCVANSAVVERMVLEYEVEIGFTEGNVSNRQELATEVFRQDELVVIAAPSHPLAAKGNRPVSAAAVCAQPMLVREPGSGTRAIIESALARKKLAISQRSMILDSPETIKHAAVANLGLAIISRLCVEKEVRAGLLKIIPLRDLRFPRPLHLVTGRGRARSSAAAAFVEMLPPS